MNSDHVALIGLVLSLCGALITVGRLWHKIDALEEDGRIASEQRNEMEKILIRVCEDVAWIRGRIKDYRNGEK